MVGYFLPSEIPYGNHLVQYASVLYPIPNFPSSVRKIELDTLVEITREKMTGKDLRIVFMGTPEFAVASLRALVEGGYNVVGVVTSPDKPAGRGQKLHESDVKRYAATAGLRVLQPEKLRAPEFLEELRALQPDLGIVIAFRMLPEVVWAMPRLGTFNLHASLLPQYRGAAPINWALINGETTTGLTTFMLNAEIDKGDIIGRVEMPILPDDNAGTLHDRLMEAGKELTRQTVDLIASGDITPLSQFDIPEEGLRPAPKIFKETCRVDWSRPGSEIANLIRGLSPYPAAWSALCDADGNEVGTIKLYDGTVINNYELKIKNPGETDLSDRNVMRIATPDGWIAVTDLQPAGKRRMTAKEFLNGLDKTKQYVFK
jgi:methionyl-tRNA formyltransferase